MTTPPDAQAEMRKLLDKWESDSRFIKAKLAGVDLLSLAAVPALSAYAKQLIQTDADNRILAYIRQLEADHKIMVNWISQLALHTTDGALRTGARNVLSRVTTQL